MSGLCSGFHRLGEAWWWRSLRRSKEEEDGEKEEDRGENKSRAGTPGNVGVTQHIVTLTDASLKAQITGLRSGHLAVSTELLLSINAYYKHTHTHLDSYTYSIPGRKRTRETCQLPPADELCMGTTGDGKVERRIRNNSLAISGSEREGQKCAGDIESFAWKSGEQTRQRQEIEKKP